MKLESIERVDDYIYFTLEDKNIVEYKIYDHSSQTFLKCQSVEYNGYIFDLLGINKVQLYKDLGIFKGGGDCPFCDYKDVDKLLKYLKENFSVESTKEKIQDPEYNWLF